MKNNFVKMLIATVMCICGVVFAVLCAQFSEAFGVCLIHNDSQMWANLAGAIVTLLCMCCSFIVAKNVDELIFED